MSQRPDSRLETAAASFIRRIRPRTDLRRAEIVDRFITPNGVEPPTYGSAWNSNNPFMLGPYHIWVDGSNRARIKNGKATSDTDGVVIGTQS